MGAQCFEQYSNESMKFADGGGGGSEWAQWIFCGSVLRVIREKDILKLVPAMLYATSVCVIDEKRFTNMQMAQHYLWRLTNYQDRAVRRLLNFGLRKFFETHTSGQCLVIGCECCQQ